uniref:Uncharacterized protein n=1 Tax=Arundo donax TaxID=35708 RepID=A0A0A9CMF0_ARUDO
MLLLSLTHCPAPYQLARASPPSRTPTTPPPTSPSNPPHLYKLLVSIHLPAASQLMPPSIHRTLAPARASSMVLRIARRLR